MLVGCFKSFFVLRWYLAYKELRYSLEIVCVLVNLLQNSVDYANIREMVFISNPDEAIDLNLSCGQCFWQVGTSSEPIQKKQKHSDVSA